MIPVTERKARLSLIIARMRGQIPARERAGDNDMLAVVLPRREWMLVRACLSAEIDRADDVSAPTRPGYRRELAFIAVTAIVGSAIAWAITFRL